MESVALKARERASASGSTSSRRAGPRRARRRRCASTCRSGRDLRLVGRGPALFAEDQRVLQAFAAAAQTAYEGRQLSAQARGGARRSRPSTASAPRCWPRVGHDLRTPLAGDQGRRSAACARRDVDWSDERARRAAGDDRGVRRPARRDRRQPARRQPPAGRRAERAVQAGRARRGGRRRGARRARRRRSASTVDVPEDLPLVQADPGLLERVLANLLDNALRHGAGGRPDRGHAPSPGARARSSRSSTTARACPQEQRERLFEPFQRLDDRGSGGVGLGLTRRARVRRGDGRRADRRPIARRRADDAPAAAARARVTRGPRSSRTSPACAGRSRSTSARATTR